MRKRIEKGFEMIQRQSRQVVYVITRRICSHALIMLSLLAIVACTSNSTESSRSEAFKQYETIIRWSQWDAAADFLSQEYLKENPVTRLDMDRLRLFRVTQYTLRSTSIYDEGMTAHQTVEIRLFNNTQAVERTIIDEQDHESTLVVDQQIVVEGIVEGAGLDHRDLSRRLRPLLHRGFANSLAPIHPRQTRETLEKINLHR